MCLLRAEEWCRLIVLYSYVQTLLSVFQCGSRNVKYFFLCQTKLVNYRCKVDYSNDRQNKKLKLCVLIVTKLARSLALMLHCIRYSISSVLKKEQEIVVFASTHKVIYLEIFLNFKVQIPFSYARHKNKQKYLKKYSKNENNITQRGN